MKLKINKACDLSSISVLPRHTRRSNAVPTGPQASQLRSQTSQQSFSQGLSSQHGFFSQLSQNSLEEAVTNDQRFGSQERENSLKRVSSLPPVNYTREESQMPMSRSSTNPMHKWNFASVPDHKSQHSEELEHRIGMIETSLNRFGMILDSVQSNVIQVSKGTKEISLETESIRHKLILHDTSLQLMNKGQADIKASLDEAMKFISDQLSKDTYQEKLQKIFLVLSTIPEQMETSLRKSQIDLFNTFTREVQAMTSLKTVKITDQKIPTAAVLPVKVTGCSTTSQTQRRSQQPLNPAKHSVKPEQDTCRKRAPYKKQKQKNISSIEQERVCRVIIESDEDINGGFSCLLDEKEIGNNFIEEAKEETERILRKARRTKRKYCNTIIIN